VASTLLTPTNVPPDVSIGVGQGTETTTADEFGDQYSIDCDLDCGDVDYKLVFAQDGTPVDEDLATLNILSSKDMEVIASTDLFSYHGTHEVAIEGTSHFTEPFQNVATPTFMIHVDGCFEFSCAQTILFPHDQELDIMPASMHVTIDDGEEKTEMSLFKDLVSTTCPTVQGPLCGEPVYKL